MMESLYDEACRSRSRDPARCAAANQNDLRVVDIKGIDFPSQGEFCRSSYFSIKAKESKAFRIQQLEMRSTALLATAMSFLAIAKAQAVCPAIWTDIGLALRDAQVQSPKTKYQILNRD